MLTDTLKRLAVAIFLVAFVFVDVGRASPAHAETVGANAAGAQTVNLLANFRLYGEVLRFGIGYGDLDIHFGVNGPAASIGRMEFVPGGAFHGYGVLSGLHLPASGFTVVDEEFSVPFSLDIDQPTSMYIGIGDNGIGGPQGGDIQIIFDFTDETWFDGSLLELTRDQGLRLTSVTLADGSPLADSGLQFAFIPGNTWLTAAASAFDTQGAGLVTNSVLATDPATRAAVFLRKAIATSKLRGGSERGGNQTDALADLDLLPEPDPYVFDLAYATVSGSNNIILTRTGSGFQPSVKIAKAGPASAAATGTATYNITIENTSSADSPNLRLDSFTDSVVAGVTPPAACASLAPGASCSFSYTYVVQAGDPDPLVNMATVHYHPDGFTDDISSSSTWSTDLLHPGFTVTKACKAGAEPVSQAGPAVFTITFNNTGDTDLHVVPSEGAPFDVAAGQLSGYDYSVDGPFSASADNTVTGSVTLATKYGPSNPYSFSASGTCIVEGRAKVVKTVGGQPPAADQTFTFELRQGASTVSDGTILGTETTDASGNISFPTSLAPGPTYQICEQVFPGWNTNLSGDGSPFVPTSIIPPSLPNPNVNNLTVCADFTVTSGQTRTFTVGNTPPGGRAWKIFLPYVCWRDPPQAPPLVRVN